MDLIKKLTSDNRKKENRLKKLEIAAAAGASLAVTVIGVAALTAFYAKTLMDINYIEENDVYNDCFSP